MLNASIKEQYDKNGYHLFHEPVFSKEKFDELKSIFETLNEENKKSNTDLMDVPHFRDARLLKFLMSERVLDLVETFIGPNIGLYLIFFSGNLLYVYLYSQYGLIITHRLVCFGNLNML